MSDRNLRKTRVGVVRSDKMDKTIVVTIHSRYRHPLYGKIIGHTKKFKAHDEENACGIGDTVRVMETQPAAIRAFQRIGFQIEATLRGHVRDANGRSRNLVLMGNDIAQIWLAMENLVSDLPPTRELLGG